MTIFEHETAFPETQEATGFTVSQDGEDENNEVVVVATPLRRQPSSTKRLSALPAPAASSTAPSSFTVSYASKPIARGRTIAPQPNAHNVLRTKLGERADLNLAVQRLRVRREQRARHEKVLRQQEQDIANEAPYFPDGKAHPAAGGEGDEARGRRTVIRKWKLAMLIAEAMRFHQRAAVQKNEGTIPANAATRNVTKLNDDRAAQANKKNGDVQTKKPVASEKCALLRAVGHDVLVLMSAAATAASFSEGTATAQGEDWYDYTKGEVIKFRLWHA